METKGYAHTGQLKIFFLYTHIAKIFLRAKHTHTETQKKGEWQELSADYQIEENISWKRPQLSLGSTWDFPWSINKS